MNKDFEFKQLMRAYRAGIITEETFEQEMATLGGAGAGNGSAGGFEAMGQTYSSEREAVAAMLDRFRAGEANGQVAFSKWLEQCSTECIRSGLRMICEREGYHARVLERRMSDLGVPCKAEVTEPSLRITERLGNSNLSDKEKLLYLATLVPDAEAFFKPAREFAAKIKDDLESKELLDLFIQDEVSSTKWLMHACQALNGAAQPTASGSKSASAMV